jgi:hypothetical protein
MPAIAGHLVQCNQCGAQTVVLDGQNVHDALDCPCCPTATHTHAGPDQETATPACRNVTVLGNAAVDPALGGF